MSPTSTERRRSAEPPRAFELRPRSFARFRRARAALIVVLVVLCALFLTLGYLQGPKLSSAQVDVTSVITQPGQQLRLFANQSLAQVKAGQVTVTPDVAHSVTTQGQVIAVQFNALLQYSTTYSVTVREVTSVYQAQPATISYSFTTAGPTLYYLDRGPTGDTIATTTITGTGRTALYSAQHIQDFVVTDGALAVATLNADNTSSLALVSRTDGAVEQVILPDKGVVQKLGAAGSGTMIGFTLTSAGGSIAPTYSSTLMVLNLEGARKVQPVGGLDGTPMRVLGWEFLPQGSSLLALTRDRSLFAVDPLTSGSVAPLGQFTELGPISRDGTIVTVNDPFGSAALTIADGSQRRLVPSPLAGDSSKVYLGPAEVLGSGARLEKVVIAQPGGTRFSSAIVLDDGAASSVIYRTPRDAGSIESFSVSPNGQYVAIDVVPDISAAVSDGYYFDARSTSTETVIVEIATGRIVKSVEGFSLAW